MEVTRRNFLVATGGAASAAWAVEDKVFDGGLADVTPPGDPVRETPVLPAGAGSHAAFRRKCVGCQLCVTACPSHVLRMSARAGRFFLPELTFRDGYCDVNCSVCGRVCPSGAIAPLPPERKKHVHAGFAVFHPDRCLCLTEGTACTACVTHCPVKAVFTVPRDPKHPGGVQMPVVDRATCIGCGACEHVCPARPLPAMHVEGVAEPREIRPMGPADTQAEAKRLLREGKAAVVVFRDGVFTAHANGRGLMPLLRLYDDDATALLGATVVDKVIGRAAAAICVAAGVKAVHALLMGDDAKAYLEKRHIAATADRLVPQILNRDLTDRCPMEKAVTGFDDPKKMIAAIRRTAERLRREAGKK